MTGAAESAPSFRELPGTPRHCDGLGLQAQQVAFELRTEYDTAQKDAELLNIYNSGLMPQARAEYQSGIAAYQNNRSDFQTLLNSFLDALHLDEEYWQTFADREDALAGIEQLTGLSLRQEGPQQ